MSQLIKRKFPSITSIDVGTDGNTSFLRAARNGQLEKVLEHLESNIDINTSNANGLNALHLASKDGHVEIVEELLKRGAVIDAATKKGNTALHIASLAGQEEVVKLLVNHGASVNVQSQNGFTPLYMAAQENHDNVVKYLLANGANQSLSTEDGFTPLAVAMQQGHDKVVTVLLENDTRGKVRLPALHIAAKKDDVKAAKLLLENEHNPDVTSKSGFTPLHIASHYGNQAIANLLVQKGADVNYAAKHNITPLHVAAKWGKTNMVTVLLEQGANIESKTRDGLTPLHCAARSGHEQVVDMLLEKGAPISSKTKNGLAPLHMAAQGDHVDAARILLYHRAPVDEVTVDYLTALHVAAHCGHVRVAKLLLDRQADANARALNGFTPLHIACKKNRIKVVELLLKHGASIGATTESGLTPLHVASFMGCMNIVIYLLQHDANPDVPTVRGETPLHLAARANQTDIIRILLRNGAQVDARAREQQTPLHIASRLGNVDIVMLLLQHGAKVDNTTKDMYTALHIAAKEGQDEVAATLIDNGASLNATTKKGFTPLHLAAKYGHLKVAKLLLQKEAPVDAQGKNGVTPLHVASHYDHQNVALLLLEKGASPYATAKNGHTPLHIAAKKNQMDIANTLLEYGAKPNAESKAGFTPLHLGAQEGHCDMSDLLIEHKADPNHNAKNGLTPLHLCAQEDKVPVAEILVKNGGEVDAATKNGYTPLHIASHYGQINMVRFLLSHGANVKATTALGYTPLHQAAQQGHTSIVDALLENSAQPNATTNNGQTPLHIAEKLGYITVIDTLKVVTQPLSPITTSISNEEKYKVVAPEAMHETFMSDSEEEGGEDTVLGDQTYRYLTADEMKSLGDDSLPIDVTRDERIDSNKMAISTENMLPPRHIEDNISPEHVQQNYIEYIKKYTPDNVDIDRHPINIGFLVSFLVDARGGAMRGCRHSGVRVIVPPRCASSPTRITCRYVRPQRTPHPPPLMEGEALASRVLELGPVGAKFLGPVIIEVPHFAALRGKEREIVILRSDNGESWKEHTVDATEEVLNDVLHDSFEAEDLNQLEDVSSGRITRIVTQDFPQYFAVVSRIRQEVHAIGPEGGMVSSTVVPQVQAVFPQGALTKKIKVGLQAQPVDPELTAKLLGHGVAVSPVVTIEPRRRKFHKPIMLSMPAPRAHSQGMINQYSGSAPTLRLLCSITGGTTKAHWEDVTGSTPLNFVNDCVTFTTTVSARFWLMDCRNVDDATKMATALYSEAIHVPFMAKFVVFAKRVDPLEARLRVFCMTDDKEDKTLEHQEHFTEVAKSRDVEVLEGKAQYIEFAGNLVPITKSGEQLQFSFRAFRENRLPFSVRVKDQHAEAVSRCLFMREAKLPKGEPPQQPICILNIVLPDDIIVDTISLTDSDSLKKLENFDYYRPDPRLADMSNLLGEDWVPLATHLGLTTSEINVIKSEYPDSVAKQAQSMLRMWLSQSGNKAQTNTLESALKRIGREDIIPQCLNVENTSHGIKEIGKQRLIKTGLEEVHYEKKDIIKEVQVPLRKVEDDVFDKYSAEEKIVETSDEEDFNKTVSERRHQIEEQLSVDRTVPASSQRVEIVQEISSIKRQSLVENKRAEVEQKAVGEIVDGPKTTSPPSTDSTISSAKDIEQVDAARRDSTLLEGVTQRFEQKTITKISSGEDPKSPKVSKTPPPSPADFIIKEKAAAIQDWDASKKPAVPGDTSYTEDGEQQGLSTTTERLVASNEETLLDKPLGQQLTGLSVIDDYLSTDLRTVFEQTNAFIQSESQPEPFDPIAEKFTRKEPISTKIIDNKNNMNEKKKSKKGFFGSIKTFVERSFESDSESEKSPKKSKKPKKDKKKKSKQDESITEQGLPPRKPKLPTPPLAPSDLDSIPFVEVTDLPPPYSPPDVPKEQTPIPVTDLDADFDLEQTLELKPDMVQKHVKQDEHVKYVENEKQKSSEITVDVKDKVKEKKKAKGKTLVVEEVTKTIQPLVIEAEEFSIIVDPTKKESPKKSKETFTINIDESIDKIEKELMEKSPILSEEKIVKPFVALESQREVSDPQQPDREHHYEDIAITADVTSFDVTVVVATKEPEDKVTEEKSKGIIEKLDTDISKESELAEVESESRKKGERKTSFFGLFKKKDMKKEEDADVKNEEDTVEQNVEKIENAPLSESVIKDMNDSQNFLSFEVKNYYDVRSAEVVPAQELVVQPEAKEVKSQSDSFFGLFKKQKKEVKEPIETKKAKKHEKTVEQQSKVTPFSEEVLKNMLDSKRFIESEVRNYEDAPHSSSLGTQEVLKTKDILLQDTTDISVTIKAGPSPKKARGEKEPSPKPGVLTGLFKKLRRDEFDSQESKDGLSEQALEEMKQTEAFLGSEVSNYEDVKEIRKRETADVSETVKASEVNELFDLPEIAAKTVDLKAEPLPEKTREQKEGSPKLGMLTGLFKKLRKDEPGSHESKDGLSEHVLIEIKQTETFLCSEVSNYEDVKEIVKRGTSDISQPGKALESQEVSHLQTVTERANYQDGQVSPKEIASYVVETVGTKYLAEKGETTESLHDVEQVAEKADDVKDSSQKPFSGLFDFFKKSKKEEGSIEIQKQIISDIVVQNVKDTKQFLMTEIDYYHDVKPPKFDAIEKEKVEEVGSEDEPSPKPLRGLFGIFKKQKKEEPPENKDTISSETVENIKDVHVFLKSEVDNYDDVKPAQFQKIKEEPIQIVSVEASPKSSRGLFGAFKKSVKESEVTKSKSDISDNVQKEISESHEVDKSHEEKLDSSQVTSEAMTSTAKTSGGLFGIFKKSKKSSEDTDEAEIAIRKIVETDHFLNDEIDNYADVKPEKFALIQDDMITKRTETMESSPKSQRGLFGIFKKTKQEDGQTPKIESVSEDVVKDAGEFLKEDILNYHDAKMGENIVTTSEEIDKSVLKLSDTINIQSDEDVNTTENIGKNDKQQIVTTKSESVEADDKVETEVKSGFLNKYRKTKKTVTLVEPEISKQQVEVDMENTRIFILNELENYDVREDNTMTVAKEEKVSTFGPTTSTTVLERQLAQPEIAQVVEITKKDAIDATKGGTESVDQTTVKLNEPQNTPAEDIEGKPAKKEKQFKDKKGFFNIFGKKTKSQDGSVDDLRGRSEEEIKGGSPKKQKRRKSSPFKFFEKTKKSEEDSKLVESEIVPSTITETSSAVPKDDLMTVEFDEPVINLSDEILDSLNQKMKELKNRHPPEAQKQITDCRDFLFIEVDNYEDGKPVITTDIDTDLSNNATKTVDSIIQSATKVVQVVAEQKSTDIIADLNEEVNEKTNLVSTIVKDTQKVAESTTDTVKENFENGVKITFNNFTNFGDKLKDTVLETKTDQDAPSEYVQSKTQSAGDKLEIKHKETIENIITKTKENIFIKAEEIISEKKQQPAENLCDLKDSTKKAIARTHEMLRSPVSNTQTEITQNGRDTKQLDSEKSEERSKHEEHFPEFENYIEETTDQITDITEKFSKTADDSIRFSTSREGETFVSGIRDIPTEAMTATDKLASQKIAEATSTIDKITKTTLEEIKDYTEQKFDWVQTKTDEAKTISDISESFATADTASKVDAMENELHKIAAKRITNLKTTGSDPLSKTSQVLDDNLQKGAQITEEKTKQLEQAGEETRGLASRITENISNVLSQEVQGLASLAANQVEENQQRINNFTKLQQEIGDECIITPGKIVDTVSHGKQIFEDKINEHFKDFSDGVTATVAEEMVGTAARDTRQLFEQGAQSVELESNFAQQADKSKQDISNLSGSFLRQSDKTKTVQTYLDDLVDHHQSSYVTMARRAESQRFPTGEGPTVREIKSSQLDSDSDEDHYTVTEPEDVESRAQDRKPLFHLESEEDDSQEIGKSKARRDSVKSNVLETLTDNKLENLLSDLEVQLVKDLEEAVTEPRKAVESKVSKAESELKSIQNDSQTDVQQIEDKLRDLDKALDSLEQSSDSKLEKKLHRVERKFERMASEIIEKEEIGTSPTEVEQRRENDFQKLVSQLSTEEVSDFQREYSHLWDETTFSKSDDWDSKTPDSQVDVQELPQGEESSLAATGAAGDSSLKAEKDNLISVGQQSAQSSSQHKPIADQHQLSEEMKLLMKELEEESKQ